jgi:hypothetical protein
MLVQIGRECTPSYLFTRISNLLQPAQAEAVLGQRSTYLASWVTVIRLWTVGLYSVHCIVYRVQCTVYSVRCTVYGVQCTVYSVHLLSARSNKWSIYVEYQKGASSVNP